MRFKKCAAIVALALTSILLAGCGGKWPWETDGGGGNTTQQVIITLPGGATGVPTSPPPGNCPGVDSVRVEARLGGTGGQLVTSFAATTIVTMDATPKNSGDPMDERCHGPSVSWSSNRTDCRFLGATSGFNPEFTCDAPGAVTVTAVVAQPGGVGTAALTVTE